MLLETSEGVACCCTAGASSVAASDTTSILPSPSQELWTKVCKLRKAPGSTRHVTVSCTFNMHK